MFDQPALIRFSYDSFHHVTPMSVFDPLPSSVQSGKIVCCYVNATSKIQIARVTDVPNWYFERVVFPGQHLIFEAIASGHLEIHTGMMASAILSDTIPCVQLQIEEVAEVSPLPAWVPVKPAEQDAPEPETVSP